MEIFKDEKVPAVDLPASKSILIRQLLLSALGNETVGIELSGTPCEDVRAMIDCLGATGVRIEEEESALRVFGCGGKFADHAELFVRESAACARFLSAALAFGQCEEATFYATGTLIQRPMGILGLLKAGGAEITPLKQGSAFPFRLSAKMFSGRSFIVDTDESTQYLSALLLSAGISKEPVTLFPMGRRIRGGYLQMTLSLLRQFLVATEVTAGKITVYPGIHPPKRVRAEVDLSAAGYLCALALLRHTRIFLKNASRSRLQPDDGFLELLTLRGLKLNQFDNGLLADGSCAGEFSGFDCDFSQFSDQAPTAALLAAFASTPSHLYGLSHTRRQECDRLHAIALNLTALGIPTEEEEDGVMICPAPLKSATIETFGDHRIAMAFALAGAGAHVVIRGHDCCKKSFGDYFNIIERLKLLDIALD